MADRMELREVTREGAQLASEVLSRYGSRVKAAYVLLMAAAFASDMAECEPERTLESFALTLRALSSGRDREEAAGGNEGSSEEER